MENEETTERDAVTSHLHVRPIDETSDDFSQVYFNIFAYVYKCINNGCKKINLQAITCNIKILLFCHHSIPHHITASFETMNIVDITFYKYVIGL